MSLLGKNSRKIRLIDICIIILVLMNSGYALTTGMNRLLVSGEILLVFLVAFSRGDVVPIPKHDIRQQIIFWIVISMVSTIVVNVDFGAGLTYVSCLLFVCNAYLFRIMYDSETIINVFRKLMTAMAVTGIIISLLNYIIPFSSYSFVVANGSQVKYYTLGIVCFQLETFSDYARWCGMFWEPGLCAGFLALAGLLDIYTGHDKKQKWRVLIYGIGIYFTCSTAGYIYLIVLFLMLATHRVKKEWGKILIVVFGVGAIIGYAWIDDIITILVTIYPEVFSKILWKNESYMTRMGSPLADLQIIFTNILGVGFGNIQKIRTNIMNSLGIQTSLSTSTLTYYGATCGWLFFIAYNYLWLSNFLTAKKNIFVKILGCILFGMILTSSPMYNNQFIWILLFIEFPKKEEF